MDFTILDQIIDQQAATVSTVLMDTNAPSPMFEHNLNVQMRSASIIKLYILACCAEAFENGTIIRENTIEVPFEDRVPFSLVTDLSVNKWRIDDLATLMIILSDNTATNILIDLLGMDAINAFIKKNGYVNTSLQRKMMDFESAAKGMDNYTSLADTTRLLLNIHEAYQRGSESAKWMLDVLYKQKDKTMLSRFLPETIELAHKTGLNDGAQLDVGFFNHNNKLYIFGVFLDGEPDEIKGFECIGRIGKHMYMEVQNEL